MAYQQVTRARSTRFPFMGVGAIGCDCQDGLGAVTQLPGYDVVSQYYKNLTGSVQRELYQVRYNPSVYSSAFSKISRIARVLSPAAAVTSSAVATLSASELQQLVLQLLARTGAALVVAKTLEQAYVANYPGARVAYDRVMSAARTGLSAITVFVQQASQARRGTSGLGDGELLPALGAGALVAVVLAGFPGANIVIGAAVAYAVYNALQSTEQAMSDGIRISHEFCDAQRATTGQPCTPEQFAALVRENQRQIIEDNDNNPLNKLINELIGAGTSALKTVLIVGGIAIVAYIGVSLLLRKAARAII